MHQALIPLESLRAELRRRLEMIRRQRPFPGRSIGTFGGPARATAKPIEENTMNDINALSTMHIKAAREAAQEIETLAIALRTGYANSDCADLLVRGMTMRIQSLAGIVTSAIDPDCNVGELLREIGLEETA